MNKRYLRWAILLGLLSVLASQIMMRAELRAFFSLDYWRSVSRYGKVLRIVESQFVDADKVTFHEMTDVALRSAVRSLDPYSDYMTSEDYVAFNRAANQEYVGVGIEVGQFSGRIILTQVFEQGSAGASGLLVGDFIVGVDGTDVRDESLAEVVERIRGEPGSRVRVEIERPLVAETLSFDLERREIALDTVVEIEMETAGVGYLRIRQFNEGTYDELVAALDRLKNWNMRGLVLDLRGNPGGRLDTAAKIAEIFLEEGQAILTVQSRRGVEEVFRVRPSDSIYRQPMILLIDGNSASASEILAGALRDHGRAILVGEKTYGKGSVQSVYGFSGGDGLKVTSARYLLPGGEAINGTGVFPGVTIEQSDEETILLMLQRHHLRRVDADRFTREFGFEPLEDSQLETAIGLMESILAKAAN